MKREVEAQHVPISSSFKDLMFQKTEKSSFKNHQLMISVRVELNIEGYTD